MIEYTCSCGFVMGLWNSLAGKMVRCPECGKEGRVQAPHSSSGGEPMRAQRPAAFVSRAYAETAAATHIENPGDPGRAKPFFSNFVEESLLPGERVLYSTTLHWIVLVWPALCLIAAGSFYFAVSPRADTWVRAFVGLLLVGAGAAMARAVMAFLAAEFTLTNLRVIVKHGFIRRLSIETLLGWVEGIYVDQGIVGRVVNFGTLTIVGLGGTRGPYYRIHGPMEFRRRVQQELAATEPFMLME